MYVEIVQSGVPSFFRQGLASVASIALNKMAAGYGDAAGIRDGDCDEGVYAGILGADRIRSGLSAGGRLQLRCKEVWQSKGIVFVYDCSATVFMAVFAVLGYLAAPQLIRFFISSDPDVVKIGTQSLRFQCLSMPFLPLNICCNMTFQTIGRAGLATFLSTGRQGYAFLAADRAFSAFHRSDRCGGGAADRGCDLICHLRAVHNKIYKRTEPGQVRQAYLR